MAKRGGKRSGLPPREETGRLTSMHLKVIRDFNQKGLSIRQIALIIWRKYGYASPEACRSAIQKGFSVRGMTAKSRSEAMTDFHHRRKNP